MDTHFSHKKCHVLTLGKFYDIIHTQRYTVHQQELEHVFEQKDLGVILDVAIKFDEYISVKVKKANAIAGLIRRTFFISLGSSLEKIIHCIRKTTSSIQASNMDTTVEKIYNYCEKCAVTSHKIGGWFSSHELLRKAIKLNLPSLVYRRARGDMIEIFKSALQWQP